MRKLLAALALVVLAQSLHAKTLGWMDKKQAGL